MRFLLLLCLLGFLQSPLPQSRFEWEAAGRKLYSEKHYAESADAFRQAVKNGDRTANTRYNLACSLALAGKADDALACLASAIRAGYSARSHMESDSDLNSLHNDRRWQTALDDCKKMAEARNARMSDPEKAQINIENLRRFWRAFEAARKDSPQDWANACATRYLRDADGPLTYMIARAKMNPAKFAKMVETKKEYFTFLDRHQQDFASQASALRAAFRKFKAMYADARFPDTYVMIGGFNSGGTTNDDGLLIGAELFGRYPDTPMQELGDWQKRVLIPASGFVPLAVHECAHYQQKPILNQNLLAQTIIEGSADFVSYLVTGEMPERTRNLHFWGNSREREIWLQFQKEMDGESTAGWLYGNPKPDWPDDVGYWLGFKICESYYGRAEDKAKALKEILTTTNPKAFLEASHYADKFGS